MSNNSLTQLTEAQLKMLRSLTDSLSPEQIVWVQGYIAALAIQNPVNYLDPVEKKPIKTFTYVPPVRENPEGKELTILYGSRTGNGETIAKEAQRVASVAGFKVALKSMDGYSTKDLKNERNVLVIISTHGDGVPPFQAREFFDFIHSKRAPKLDELNFSVLALGDSTYAEFCKAGKDVDAQLEKLGAHRNFPRVDCDVDFRDASNEWIKNALATFGGSTAPAATPSTVSASATSLLYTKEHPYHATVLDKIFLHGRGSDRQTIHVEFSLEGSGLQYEPGDSLGVIATNSAQLVAKLLETVEIDLSTEVTINDETLLFSEVLAEKYELTTVTADVLKRFAEFTNNDELKAVLTNTADLKKFLYGKDIVDLFTLYPTKVTPEELMGLLRKLQPRLYSISSSPLAHPDEVHLTVGVVKYKSNDRHKAGLCSVFLSDRIDADENAQVFIEKNENFRLPKDPKTPIIMIGAGTGVAPYRAFVEHRAETEGSGKSWLFFGNRFSESEFLYQLEWQKYLKDGVLTHLDVAFSRDSEEKVYVQDRILAKSKEIYEWLKEGAHIYICGDMKQMATAVHKALQEVVVKEGKVSEEDAEFYLTDLQRNRRYQTDVY